MTVQRWAKLWATMCFWRVRIPSPYFANVGEPDRALDWLERAVEERSPVMPYLAIGTWPDEIQTHPRFREIRRRMGFPGRD